MPREHGSKFTEGPWIKRAALGAGLAAALAGLEYSSNNSESNKKPIENNKKIDDAGLDNVDENETLKAYPDASSLPDIKIPNLVTHDGDDIRRRESKMCGDFIRDMKESLHSLGLSMVEDATYEYSVSQFVGIKFENRDKIIIHMWPDLGKKTFIMTFSEPSKLLGINPSIYRGVSTVRDVDRNNFLKYIQQYLEWSDRVVSLIEETKKDDLPLDPAYISVRETEMNPFSIEQ